MTSAPLIGTIPVTHHGDLGSQPRPLHRMATGRTVTISGTISGHRDLSGQTLLVIADDGATGMLLLPEHIATRLRPLTEGQQIQAHGVTDSRADSIVVIATRAQTTTGGAA